MPAVKPQLATQYSGHVTELAERVLLEVWTRLGDFHDYLVLVGGLVPRYLIQGARDPYGMVPQHCGAMDIDLGISLAVADLKTYSTVRSTLVDRLAFRPGRNDQGGEQRHSFFKTVGGVDITVDFLTTGYGGPQRVIRDVTRQLSAIQVKGLGLALANPIAIPLEGDLLEDGRVKTVINVCRPLPFIILKALALKNRNERMDAYDLVYVLRYFKNGPSSIAEDVSTALRETAAFQQAMIALHDSFGSPSHNGPRMYANFLGNSPPDAHLQAFATVQEFLEMVNPTAQS